MNLETAVGVTAAAQAGSLCHSAECKYWGGTDIPTGRGPAGVIDILTAVYRFQVRSASDAYLLDVKQYVPDPT